MLDTNIVSALLDPPGSPRRIACEQRMAAVPGRVTISVFVDAEVQFGLKKRLAHERLARYWPLRDQLGVSYVSKELRLADIFGMEKAELARTGWPLEDLDMLICCHAMALDAILVSNDRAIDRFARLKLENWLLPSPGKVNRRHEVAEPAARYDTRLASTHGRRFGTPALSRPIPADIWMTSTRDTTYASSHAL